MSNIGIKIIGLVLLIGSLITSCQKELSAEIIKTDSTGSGTTIVVNPSSSTGLLIKSDLRGGASATDSSITYYGYDTAKRLVSQTLVGSPSNGISPNNSFIYYRNTNGIITQVVQKNATMAAQGVDSTITKVVYDATLNQYKYTTSSFTVFGFTTYDSTVFIYTSGKFSQSIGYSYSQGFGATQYTPSIRFDFVYTANQFTSMLGYSYDVTSSSFKNISTYTFQYDSNVKPLIVGVDAPIILSSPESANNNTSMVVSSTNVNFTLATSFTYNSANKPATAIVKNSLTNTTQNATFYYQ